MSRGERKETIRRGHPGLSLGRQCHLLSPTGARPGERFALRFSVPADF